MRKTNIEIGDKKYKVVIAETEETRRAGLLHIKELPEDKGMLFIFDEVGKHEMWMKDTYVPLDLIFIDKDKEVIKVATRQPEDGTLIGVEGTKYVLEVCPHSGIEEGDFLDMEDDDDSEENDLKLPTMKVLAPDGSTQMELKGGERIFSRKNTKVLIKLAKRAGKSKSESDYKRLGKSVFKFLHILDNREPEYVKAPK